MLNFGRGRASLISDLDASRRSSSRSKYRPEYSKPSLLLVLIPTWFCCVVVLTAYMQCLHHYRNHSNSTLLSASDPSEALRRSEIVANNESSMPPLSPVVQTHDVQLSRHDRVYDPPLDPKLIIAPEITFTPSFHGVQVFVHTLLATDLQLKTTDVSWVTQLTVDRLDIFGKMLQRWHGPVSATLYVRDMVRDLAAITPLRARVDFHLVLADLHPGRLYPVNTLRNVAIDKCRAHWMVLVDADFVPNEGLYEDLLPRLDGWEKGDSAVYVIPAFQLMHGETRVPANKAELLSMGDRVSPVHPEPGRDIAHKYTDYPRWRTAEAPYVVEYHMPYEPYFVANKRLPRYDTGFLGYGNDKTEHCLEVFKARMRYTVLPAAFVFHVAHPRGDWQLSDQPWVVRASTTLWTFFEDVQQRYPPPHGAAAAAAAAVVEPTAGPAGDNCTAVCARAGRGCRPDLWRGANTCAALRAAFGERCGSCGENFYGHDLPAFNTEQKACLVNSKPSEYPTACDVRHPLSERLCPCGPPVPMWLTAEYVVGTLSLEGKWGGVSPSLLGEES